MPITIDYDITDLPAYAIGEAKGKAEGEAKGKAEGKAEGEAKGKAEGKAEGEAKGKAEAITKMLLKGFSPEQIADILEIPMTYVLNIQNNLPKK